MATRGEMVAAITAYMAARKRIQGYDSAPTWAPGFYPYEVVMKYPLEVGGELRGRLRVGLGGNAIMTLQAQRQSARRASSLIFHQCSAWRTSLTDRGSVVAQLVDVARSSD